MDAGTGTASFDDMMVHLGRNLVTARNACGWTQVELAERAGVGRSSVAKIESYNTNDISLSTLQALARAFDVPPYLLLLGPNDWANLANISSLPDLVRQRRPNIGVETVARLERLSSSPSQDDQDRAVTEIQDIATGILFESSEPTERGEAERSQGKEQPAIPWTVSAALSTRMLPRLPVLNAVIAGILSHKRTRY